MLINYKFEMFDCDETVVAINHNIEKVIGNNIIVM